MFENLRFYTKHSLNDLRVNGQRTFFALLCIAAGVAAIVSLQTLAVMIQSSLVGSLQESNRGDIQIQADSEFMGRADEVNQAVAGGLLNRQTQSIFGQSQDSFLISQGGIQAIQTWLDQHDPGQAQVTYRQPLADPISLILGGGNGTTLLAPATGTEASQVVPVLIDPQVYPFYGTITAQDGQPLANLITAPTDIVVSAPVAQLLNANIGDSVKISGSDADFTLRGIVETAQEVKNPASDTLLSLFGFYYLDKSAITLFENVQSQADAIFIQLADASKVAEITQALKQQFPFATTTTTEDLRQNYTQLSDAINKLVTVMGLLSMLIGSIGIINTMQVIVRRRTVEVAVLKTLGLQGNQITLLFLIEAVLMGIFGGLIGIVLGWGLTFLIRGVAERVLATTLPFILSPAAALTGFVVGVIVTTVFGFLPTLTAGQVRPGVVLRPSDAVIPKAGRVQTLLSLGLIIVVLSLIAQTILGSFATAFAVVVGAFVAAGVLYLLLNFVIWLIGRFVPSFGIIDLKLSLRQMVAGRGRASMTLLALVIGVFSLSTITLLADSVNSLLSSSLASASGGNVTISVGFAAQLPNITRLLDQTPGVEHYEVQHSYAMNLLSVQEGDTMLTLDDLRTRLVAAHDTLNPFGASDDDQPDPLKILQSTLGSIGVADLTALPEHNFSAGRQLTSADAGKPVMVIGENRYLTAAGISVGDKLTFAVNRGDASSAASGDVPTVTFEIVGVTAQSGFGGIDVQNYAPADAFPPSVQPTSTSIVAQVDKEQVTALRQQLSGVTGVFVIDNAALTRLITNLLGTFTAFPTMVALLGLIVGGVVIANSVALTTMERRREIAVMKSVGLQRERVLFMILLENGILGLI
ncbi:MAG: FtsX-like permease family protein, partial [Chloroflexota bacterium]